MIGNKRYDLIYSLGEDCACTMFMKKYGLRISSGPFDWLTKASFVQRLDMIESNFLDFLNPNYLSKMGYIENEKKDTYENTKTGFYFYHDFPTGVPFLEAFPDIQKKYNRRIERFYTSVRESENVLLIWLSRDKVLDSNILFQSYERIKNIFPNTNIDLLVLENDFDIIEFKYEQLTPHILKITYDNASYDKSNPILETKGNFRKTEQVFKKIKIKKTFKIICHRLCFKIKKKTFKFITFIKKFKRGV